MIGLGLIVRRSLRQHLLSTAVTSTSLALAGGLAVAVFSIRSQSADAFTGGGAGFDAVLGARGSQLQLVLSAVFHLETSPGNVPWSACRSVADDPRIALAIPLALGDSYRGYRVVGTTDELFAEMDLAGGGRPGLAAGRVFDPDFREALVGSRAAERTGLRVGSTFEPQHGLAEVGGSEHEEEYTVVGVLAPTNTPADRVIWIPIEGVWRMGGHVLRGAGEEYRASHDEEIPDEHKEVSALLLKLRSPQAGFALDQELNRQGKELTLAWPIARVMAELFDQIGWMNRVLESVAVLVVLVASGSVLASIYNAMNERRREFAVLRALGARRRTVFAAIVLEAASIAAMGAAGAVGVSAAILAGAAWMIRERTGVVLDPWSPHAALAAVPAGIILLGALSGLVPAWKAYRTDVAANLRPAS